jgi:hypothetical protein
VGQGLGLWQNLLVFRRNLGHKRDWWGHRLSAYRLVSFKPIQWNWIHAPIQWNVELELGRLAPSA